MSHHTKKDDILEEDFCQEATTEPEQAAESSAEDTKPEELTEVERLQTDVIALNERYLRLAAEYDNFRKRTQREREAAWSDATAATATQFLAVVDNVERALSAPCADTEYKKGVELTAKSLSDTLEKLNIEAFGEPGETFDPERHNAVMHLEEEGQDGPSLAEVFQKGYKLGDRVLRYAMVKVVG